MFVSRSSLGRSRRWFLRTALGGLGTAAVGSFPRAAWATSAVPPALLARAQAVLEQHAHHIEHRDVIAVADFSLASSARRFHLVNLGDGSVSSHWVAHGRGSDPAHTGWLERFSNEPHSYATSAGAFRTAGMYLGAHGRSIRLEGLDATNSNAEPRGLVVHSAWYVSREMVGERGMLGRSEGCFAVSQESLEELLSRLGPGRLIYADRA